MRTFPGAWPWLVGVCIAGHLQLGCTAHHAQTGETTPGTLNTEAEVLPLTRVRLYASGVGYFERKGTIGDNHGALPVPTGHLDDALKTLVVFNTNQDLGSVSFPSRLSPAVARARAGLPADQEAVLSYDRLLVSLRGEQVELSLEGRKPGDRLRRLEGRIIDVVAVQPDHPSYNHGPANIRLKKGETLPDARERLQVLLLSARGEILRLDAGELSAIRALDDIVARRLHAALSARLATRSNQRQQLRLQGIANRGKPVTLAYLAEAPTWRASYRLLLSEAPERPGSRLQAWALVHNDTDEPWRSVHLELVDGRPNSFLFPMAAPRYERRNLETPEHELSSVPQLSTTTPDALWGDFSDYAGESVARVGGLGLSGIGVGGGGRGSGIGLGSIGSVGHGAGRGTAYNGGSDLLWAGDLARRAGVVATAPESTSVFRIEQPLDLPPQHSATVPFIDVQLSATPIVWFDGFNALAQRAVGVSNNTKNTLPSGPLAVFGRGGFLGEAMLASLKPGARQFAQISDEPDTSIRSPRPKVEQQRRHVDFRDGSLRTHMFVTTKRRITFDNQSGRTRRAYVQLSCVLNARVEGAESVDYESTSGQAFAVFELAPGRGRERTLVITEALSHAAPSNTISAEDLDELVQDDGIPTAERAILRQAKPLFDTWQGSRKRHTNLNTEIEAITQGLERLRTHVKALGKSEADSAQAKLMQRILEREDELSEALGRRRALERELEQHERAFEDTLRALDQFRKAIVAARDAEADKT